MKPHSAQRTKRLPPFSNCRRAARPPHTRQALSAARSGPVPLRMALPVHSAILLPQASRAHEGLVTAPDRALQRPRRMRVLVVIPTYNECENLPSLSVAVLGLSLGADLLVIDDNSPDGTGAVADRLAAENPRLRVLHRARRMGLGSAYVTGFKRALGDGYDAVVTMDGDWSHDPAYLPALLAPAGTHALVIGSRYLHGISVVNWSLARLILSQAANFYARTVAGLPFRDCTSGYQVVRHDALARIGLEDVRTEGYSFL